MFTFTGTVLGESCKHRKDLRPRGHKPRETTTDDTDAPVAFALHPRQHVTPVTLRFLPQSTKTSSLIELVTTEVLLGRHTN